MYIKTQVFFPAIMGLWLFTFSNQHSTVFFQNFRLFDVFIPFLWTNMILIFFSGQIWFLHVGLCYKVLHVQLLVGRWSRNMNDIWKGLDLNFTIMNMVISILQLVIWTELHLNFFIENISLKETSQNFFLPLILSCRYLFDLVFPESTVPIAIFGF